jgi:MioC protein
MMSLRIFVGSMTGNAHRIAEAITQQCADVADQIELIPMDAIRTSDLSQAYSGMTLLCVSTYGCGDVPDQGQALYTDLDERPAYIPHMRYGVIALGDSSYGETFCAGGRLFDARLQDLGAIRLGDLLLLDALDPTNPEEIAVAWCREWLTAHDLEVSSSA